MISQKRIPGPIFNKMKGRGDGQFVKDRKNKDIIEELLFKIQKHKIEEQMFKKDFKVNFYK